MSQDRVLIRGGVVLTMTEGEEAPIADGRTAAIGTGLEAGDAKVIDIADAIVMPGFVDTVFVQGKLVKLDGRLVGADVNRLKHLACESRDHLFAAAQNDETLPGAKTGGDWALRSIVAPEDE